MDLKKLVLVVLVLFVGFWMFTDPRGLASFAQDSGGGLWTMTQDLFGHVIDFLGALGK